MCVGVAGREEKSSRRRQTVESYRQEENQNQKQNNISIYTKSHSQSQTKCFNLYEFKLIHISIKRILARMYFPFCAFQYFSFHFNLKKKCIAKLDSSSTPPLFCPQYSLLFLCSPSQGGPETVKSSMILSPSSPPVQASGPTDSTYIYNYIYIYIYVCIYIYISHLLHFHYSGIITSDFICHHKSILRKTKAQLV